MLRVALTGGIATGKSHVLGRFAARGVPTVDADALVHQALASGSPTIPRIVARFGRGVLAPDGSVDRKAMAARVFGDTKARLDLEALLHPDVFRRIDEWFSALQGTFPPDALASHDGRFAVADIPLLFETHHEGLFDRIVVTRCEPALQIERVMTRSGLSEAQARARLAAQWPIEEKARLAHYVIDTSGTFEDTDTETDRVFEALTEDAEL